MVGQRKEEKRGGSGVRRDQDATMYCLYLFGPLLLKHRKKRGRERKRSQGERREVKKSKQERKKESKKTSKKERKKER